MSACQLPVTVPTPGVIPPATRLHLLTGHKHDERAEGQNDEESESERGTEESETMQNERPKESSKR